ncbi:heat shock factor-binding protein 1-like isoform X2 [Pollicipes pollicipes]|uniref:heat shock factor-binding protein 1-like isoform X2 n=1 Tax=Pollicipes pollicipes TaxID=41117 RepID=UPI001885687C|nr:heat shock factor-binding protein 1-like isoform X2 [Pollicipes pollicipes]
MAEKEQTKATEQNSSNSVPDEPKNVQSLLENMQQRFQTMSDNIISRIDEMGDRIDELEKSVADVMTQAQTVDDGDK